MVCAVGDLRCGIGTVLHVGADIVCSVAGSLHPNRYEPCHRAAREHEQPCISMSGRDALLNSELSETLWTTAACLCAGYHDKGLAHWTARRVPCAVQPQGSPPVIDRILEYRVDRSRAMETHKWTPHARCRALMAWQLPASADACSSQPSHVRPCVRGAGSAGLRTTGFWDW